MRRSILARVVTLTSGLLAVHACSQEGPGSTAGSGGSRGSGGETAQGGSTSSGGTASSGGTTASGGSDGSGGTTSKGGAAGSGGATGGSSGAAGTGGATASGGANNGGATARGGAPGSGGAGSGGATTGKGGAIASGGATSSGGASSSGGATSNGGATTGKGGATGSGGATGAGGSTGSLSPADIVPDLDGFYWEGTCSGNVSVSGKNCPLYDNGATTCATGTSWDNRGTLRNKVINVLGDAGKTYTINFEVRGVAGTRCYTGGKAASTATPSTTGANNTWYVGGKQANDSIWNTYELHVSPAVSGEANVYFLNAFPSNPDWCQKEATYQIGYTASFKVQGGGTMTFTIHDSNCQAQQNCGSNEGASTCDSPRTSIDLAGMTPAATFKQPPTNTVGTKTYYPQWLYFDVKSVTSP
jgi:hypothetical protein